MLPCRCLSAVSAQRVKADDLYWYDPLRRTPSRLFHTAQNTTICSGFAKCNVAIGMGMFAIANPGLGAAPPSETRDTNKQTYCGCDYQRACQGKSWGAKYPVHPVADVHFRER